MKKLLIAALAAAGVIAYLLNRKKPVKAPEVTPRTHHLTNVFSKAKQHAVND